MTLGSLLLEKYVLDDCQKKSILKIQPTLFKSDLWLGVIYLNNPNHVKKVIQDGGICACQMMRKKEWNQFSVIKICKKLINKIWWEVVNSCQRWEKVVEKIAKVGRSG